MSPACISSISFLPFGTSIKIPFGKQDPTENLALKIYDRPLTRLPIKLDDDDACDPYISASIPIPAYKLP